MFDFFQGGAVPLAVWVIGVVILGLAIAYGVVRAGRIRGAQRQQLDRNTLARQVTEDPQK